MDKKYSQLRNHDAHFLNAIVVDMRPLIQVFQVKVAIVEALPMLEGTKLDSHAKKQLVALVKIIRALLD